MSEHARIFYKNWRGKTSWRRIQPKKLEFAKTSWHKEEQWILVAYDLDKQAERGFAVKDIQTLILQR